LVDHSVQRSVERHALFEKGPVEACPKRVGVKSESFGFREAVKVAAFPAVSGWIPVNQLRRLCGTSLATTSGIGDSGGEVS
jgi:hypothetical protein